MRSGRRCFIDARRPYLFSRVVYSPDLRDGVGGFGAFVVLWSAYDTPGPLFAQIVSYPGRLVGPRVTVLASYAGQPLLFCPQSRHRLFTCGSRVSRSGRLVQVFPVRPEIPSRLVRLNLDAQPIGETLLSSDANRVCSNFEFTFDCAELKVAWNPISSEFGVLYSQEVAGTPEWPEDPRQSSGRRSCRRPHGLGDRADRGRACRQQHHRQLSRRRRIRCQHPPDGAELDSNGRLVARGLITSRLLTNMSSFGLMELSYSRASGTFLFAGRTAGGRNPDARAQSAWRRVVVGAARAVIGPGYFSGAAADATHCHLPSAVFTHVSTHRSLASTAFPAPSVPLPVQVPVTIAESP